MSSPAERRAHALEQPAACRRRGRRRRRCARRASSSVEHGRDRGQPGGEGEAGRAAFEIGDAALEGHAGRVLRARVFVALVDARALLRVGRGGVDRHHHRAGGRVGLLAGMDAAGGEGELVRVSIHRSRTRKWLMRSMRVTSPRNFAAVHDDGTRPRRNSGRSSATGASAEIVSSRETMTSPTGVAEHLSHGLAGGDERVEQVALVDEADDAVALDHRQLRHVGGAHAGEGRCAAVSFGATKIVGALVVAVDDDIAHGAGAARVRASPPAAMKASLNTLDRYLAPLSQTKLTTRFGACLLAAIAQRRGKQRAGGRAGEDAFLAQQVARSAEALRVGDRVGLRHQREVAVRRHEILADAFDGPGAGLAHACRSRRAAPGPSRPDRRAPSRSSARRGASSARRR